MTKHICSLPLQFHLPSDAMRHMQILADHWDISLSELLAVAVIGLLSEFFPDPDSDAFNAPPQLPDDIKNCLSTLVPDSERN